MREQQEWERERMEERKRQGPGGPSAPLTHYYTGKDGGETFFKKAVTTERREKASQGQTERGIDERRRVKK